MLGKHLPVVLPFIFLITAVTAQWLPIASAPWLQVALEYLPVALLTLGWGLSRVYQQSKLSFLLLVFAGFVSLWQWLPELTLRAGAREIILVAVSVLVLIFLWIPERMAGLSRNWQCYSILFLVVLATHLLLTLPQFGHPLTIVLPHLQPVSLAMAPMAIITAVLLMAIVSFWKQLKLTQAVGVMLALHLMLCLVFEPSLYHFQVMALLVATLVIAGLMSHSHYLAFYDALTELKNRRSLYLAINNCPEGYHLAIIDIDYFKRFNDRYGHDVGDEVLRTIAMLIRNHGLGAQAFRLGGEEFVLLFPSIKPEACGKALSQLRRRIADYPFMIRSQGDNEPHREGLTISLGLAQQFTAQESIDEVLKRADNALYRAKSQGRNRLVMDADKGKFWVVLGQ
ncbi:GGDEF domain-containing protein [Ferrimonas aestuarii]|uniref:diguanylate cyclase n=1 Tax=Ferrimonas aestuarii TaxID=2569539 RepID=A0A4U1BKP2_9GAMM|nr:GGDEF domain-containing protein [Ferrimonas aestuarii]TKB53059.1 GGDEF domain-containing protein [Ferrimonas aestuarii]